jgi:alpha-galactosidase
VAKTVIIGAGSGFGGRLSVDILSFPELRDGTLALVDINQEGVEAVGEFVREVVSAHGAGTRIETATDRRAVLEGADYVVVAIAVGGPAYNGVPFYHEIEIPKRYGIPQQIGDTLGPGGVFRTLRTAPEMLAICRDMEELCPGALLINYTNPMAMLTWAMTDGTSIRNVGLCHSVQGTTWQLAGYIGVPMDEVTQWVYGINHMSWFMRLTRAGEDLYPALREAMAIPETFAKDPVRFEVMRHLGYFVTESSPHMSEYIPFFRKRRELMEEFDLHEATPQAEVPTHKRWHNEEEFGKEAAHKAAEAPPSNEYAARIIHACETNTPYRFNGNVRNVGLVENLAPGCCVEVPCMVDRGGVHPCACGSLPTQLAALCSSNIVVQQLTTEAVLERDIAKARMAVQLDPLTAAVCSLADGRAMFDEMLAAERQWLGSYYAGWY